jgi:prepilin-type N-terminal cleavage/methylation domain-containing protein
MFRDAASSDTPAVGRPGFSILELLVVLTLMAILAAISVPSLRRWQASLPLEQSASAIQQLAARVRLDALRSGRPARLTLDPSGLLFTPTVSLTANREVLPLRLPDGIRCRLLSGDERKSSALLRSDGRLELVFHPDGTATPAGLVLSDSGGGSLCVVLGRLTGSVSVVPSPDFTDTAMITDTAMSPVEFRTRCVARPEVPKAFPRN